jgi:hypothetical protein
MAFTLAQAEILTLTRTGNTFVATLASAVTVGNALVAVSIYTSASRPITSAVVTTGSVAMTQAGNELVDVSEGQYGMIHYLPAITATTQQTVTITYTAGAPVGNLWLGEIVVPAGYIFSYVSEHDSTSASALDVVNTFDTSTPSASDNAFAWYIMSTGGNEPGAPTGAQTWADVNFTNISSWMRGGYCLDTGSAGSKTVTGTKADFGAYDTTVKWFNASPTQGNIAWIRA